LEPSFFNKSQGDGWPMVVARFEHDKLMLLGTHASGTLALKTDKTGLDYSVRLPETRSDVWELADRGDLVGSSFSFQAYEDDWRLGKDGYPERCLVSGRLVDVAPTAIPAYPDSTLKVAYRSLAMHADASIDEVEQYAESGRLAEFLGNRSPVVIDVKPVPTPLAVAERRSSSGDLDLRRRRNELYGKSIATEPRTVEQRLLDLRRRKMLWDAPTEARSLTDDFVRDRYGHAVDWCPGRA
jgi:HK97 family phage prohead protease